MVTDLQRISDSWQKINPGIQVIITREQDCLFLHLIYIPVSIRRHGYGSEIMNEITSYADRLNLPIVLEPRTEYNMDYSILVQFYQAHGFTIEGVMMVRQPLYSKEFAFEQEQ